MDIANYKSLLHQVHQLLWHSDELVMASYRRHMLAKLLVHGRDAERPLYLRHEF